MTLMNGPNEIGPPCDSLSVMNAALSPIVSEFETEEQAASYDLWLRAKVEASLIQADDPATPRYSSDEVMRKLGSVIKSAEEQHASRRLA